MVSVIVMTAACGAPNEPETLPGAVSSTSRSGSVGGDASGAPHTEVTGESLAELGWRGAQDPGHANITEIPDHVAVGGSGRPDGPLLRYVLRPGEEYVAGGRATSRAEVYGRVAPTWSAAPGDWPDPVGSERWFSFAVFLPADFALATDGAQWLDLTQWKGRDGGSPPIALEVKGSDLRLGGARANEGDLPDDGDLGPVARGQWTRLLVGLRFSADPAEGWVQVLRDGEEVIPRTPVATMDLLDGEVDPVYLKQGIYRSTTWTEPHEAYFSTVTVTEAQPTG